MRTRDLCVANATLSQLSYVPMPVIHNKHYTTVLKKNKQNFVAVRDFLHPHIGKTTYPRDFPHKYVVLGEVETTGLEPATSCTSSKCSPS